MRLIIDTIDTVSEDDTRDNEFVQLIERRIGEFYDVYPVQSYQCMDRFLTSDGAIVEIVAVSFVLVTPNNEGCHERLTSKMCDEILSFWKEKAFVVWRKRPEFIVDNNINGESVVRLRLRIGGHGDVLLPENAHREGYPIPLI